MHGLPLSLQADITWGCNTPRYNIRSTCGQRYKRYVGNILANAVVAAIGNGGGRSHVMGGDNNHSALKHINWPGRVERCAEWATRRAVPKHASLSAMIAGTYMADTSRCVTGCDTVQMVTKAHRFVARIAVCCHLQNACVAGKASGVAKWVAVQTATGRADHWHASPDTAAITPTVAATRIAAANAEAR